MALLEEAAGLPFEGYEIHMGSTISESGIRVERPFRLKPFELSSEAIDGAISGDGWGFGNLHSRDFS